MAVTANTLSKEEVEILDKAKHANPYWLAIIIKCAEVMIERRSKYAGANHPYFNFADVANDAELTMEQVLRVYVAMKKSRQKASGGKDFTDESALDSVIDEINYAALKAGLVMFNLTIEDVLNK